jgi:hypothetical protein
MLVFHLLWAAADFVQHRRAGCLLHRCVLWYDTVADTYLSAVCYLWTQTEGGSKSRGPAPSARPWAPWRSSTTGTRPWHAAYEYSSTLLRDDMSS